MPATARCAISKSRQDFSIHALASASNGSAIEVAPPIQDGGLQRSLQTQDPINLATSFNQHIFGHSQPSQTAMRPLRPADWGFVAVAHDHEKIDIAIVVRVTLGVRTVKPDLLGLKLRDQPLSHRL